MPYAGVCVGQRNLVAAWKPKFFANGRIQEGPSHPHPLPKNPMSASVQTDVHPARGAVWTLIASAAADNHFSLRVSCKELKAGGVGKQ